MGENDKALPETPSKVEETRKGSGDNTSTPGLDGVFANKSPCRLFMWSVMILFGLGLSIMQVLDLFKDFYSYPVTTVVTLKRETRATFPAVTICNINRQRRSPEPQFSRQPSEFEFPEVSGVVINSQ